MSPFSIIWMLWSLRNHLSLLQNVVSPKVENNNSSSDLQLKGLVHLEVNLVPDQLIHLIRWSHVVIVVWLIPKTDAWLIDQLVSIVTDWVIFHLCAGPLVAVLVLLKNSRQFNRFHGRGRAPWCRGTLRRQVNEATEISKAKSKDKSDLDIVRLMEAYGLSNNSPQTSLKQRVQIDDIITIGVQDIGFENIVNATTKEFTMPVPVPRKVPTEYDTCTEWEAVDELEPIPSYISHQCIQIEANIPTDWNIDALMPKTIHLIEIDSIVSDSVYTHVTLNNEICHAKLDTGAQIIVMTESLFKRIGKTNKLPLFLKSDVKLVGYGNRNTEYMCTTVLYFAHLSQTKTATFYVTKLDNDKVILGLHLCVDLQLLSVHYNDKCQCKSQLLHEAKKVGSEFPIGVDLQQEHTPVLPPVPISTRFEGDNVKQQIMELYPDLFSGVGTIKNKMIHLDVKPGAILVVCSPCHVPHAVQPKLKEELDRMLKLGVIWKLDINKASDWVHMLVIVIKPNAELCVCLDPRTLNSVLRHNVHNVKRFIDVISKVKGFTHISKIDADSGFWTLPLDPSSQLLTTFDTPWGRFCFMKLPFRPCESQYFFQYDMDLIFKKLTNAHIIADNILIVGTDLGPSDDRDHDRCLIQVLNHCQEVGLKLNAAKCIFKAKQVVFYGHLVHTKGPSPDPRKAEAITNMTIPSNKNCKVSLECVTFFLPMCLIWLTGCTL